MSEDITLTVNGTVHTVSVEPRRLLVHVLREDLGLTGTHIGCDTSSCGACTVHIDGAAALSCSILAVQADGELSEEQIREGLEGNICRCTGYQNIVTAVKQAADEMARV